MNFKNYFLIFSMILLFSIFTQSINADVDCPSYGEGIFPVLTVKDLCMTFGDTPTLFNPVELSESFSFEALPTGELNLSTEHMGKKHNIGYISGAIKKSGNRFLVEDGNFRRRACLNNFCYEVTLGDSKKNKFVLNGFLPPIPSSIEFPSDVNIIVSATTHKDRPIFIHDFDNLPVTVQNLEYTKLSCEGDDCKNYWFINPYGGYPQWDYFLLNGKYFLEYGQKLSDLKKPISSIDTLLKSEKMVDGKSLIKLDFENENKRSLPGNLFFLPWPLSDSINARYFLKSSNQDFNLDNIFFNPNRQVDMFLKDGIYSVYGQNLGVKILDNSLTNKYVFTTNYEEGGIRRTRGSFIINYDSKSLLRLNSGSVKLLPKDLLGQFRVCLTEQNHLCIVTDSERSRIYVPPNHLDLTYYMDTGGSVELSPYDLERDQTSGLIYNRKIRLCNRENNKCIVWETGNRKNNYYLYPPLPVFSWKELMFRFQFKYYDDKEEMVRFLSCDPREKHCTIDGRTTIALRDMIQCEKDSDCASIGRPSAKCINRLCIQEVKECQKLSGNGDIHILFLGLDLSDSDIKKYSENIRDKILSISPFKEYRDRFTFWYNVGTPPRDFDLFSTQLFINDPSLNKYTKCSQKPEIIFYLVDSYFISYASGRKSAISLKDSNPILTAVHELGHAFGDLADEYYAPGTTVFENLNCVENYETAVREWSKLLDSEERGKRLADQAVANNWISCGGNAPAKYKNYLRPSENSIMRHQRLSGGDQFNEISQKILIQKIIPSR